jgi:PEP-CTERM motif
VAIGTRDEQLVCPGEAEKAQNPVVLAASREILSKSRRKYIDLLDKQYHWLDDKASREKSRRKSVPLQAPYFASSGVGLMTFRHLRSFICIAALAYCASPASAAILYSDNFNVDSSASWTVNTAPTTSLQPQSAQFAFDYSVYGIPPAPGSSDTLGLRLRANVPPNTTRPPGTTSGLSVSPTGQNFGTDYNMTFYAWSNFNGAPNVSGLADNANSEGGTNNVLFALGTSGTVPLVVGNTTLVTNGQMDGIAFATTGDGGIGNDYRIYPKSGTIVPAGANYQAGSNANIAPLYQSLFGTHTAPAIQQTLSTAEYGSDAFNTQAGSTQSGAFGFAWHKVSISKLKNIVTWDVDDTRIATYNASALTMGGNNIALGQSDVNSTVTRHPSLLFTVFDNLVVSEVPEPASCTLVVLGMAAIGLVSRRRRGA